MRSSFWADGSNAPSTASRSQPPVPPAAVPNHPNSRHSGGNIFRLLARRELSPRTKHSSKKLWGEKRCHVDSYGLRREAVRDSRRGLLSWVEAESLWHLSANYCPLSPPPRSTIAAAFSPDGKTLASTHGDHTVKIIDSQTGRCLKVLNGHRRTPWVVRFHPLCPEILASGSLDHEVRLWDAKTADCIGSRDFYRPIASIAFHAQGEFLAVASGHKLYMWHYRRGETSSPTIVLKTRRSLRAVHFHPHGAPFLLTAEVNDLDSSDSTMTLASSPGYLCYSPPTLYVADGHSAQRVDPSASVRLLTYSTPSGQYELLLSPVEPSSSPVPEEPQPNSSVTEMENNTMETEIPPEERRSQFFPFSDPTYWELPFLQGWLMGQSQSQPGERSIRPHSDVAFENPSAYSEIHHPVGNRRSDPQHRSSHSHVGSPAVSDGDTALSYNGTRDESHPQHFVSRIHSEIATSLAAAAAAELPCTVKLRIWPHDIKDPCAYLDAVGCRLTIPHAVLCSEMGAHFSPCGRFLAACVACVLPHAEADPGIHTRVHHDVTGVSTSPTRHPISAHQVVYELRIYSLEEATFGLVLSSRAIRAAHCLTSIQFSPTSDHLLLAYGRRHNSLLKSIVIEGETAIPIYTILEVYRVSDMELVRVLPSAEDEVNVACFHPLVGGGIVYGTKEGKLRILQYDISHGKDYMGSCFLDQNMPEVPTFALEC